VETAKVDIRKLQQLNDRINQCLDALQQVRLSVHGLSHSSAIGAGFQGGIPNTGFGPQAAFGQQGFGQTMTPFGQQVSPFGALGAFGAVPQPGIGFGGLSHTGYGQQQFPQVSQAWNPMLQQNPLLQQQAAFSPFAQLGGLSHTGVEGIDYTKPTWADPLLQAKVAQTFPYAQYAVPPIVALY
jgi:hypothetical protein